MSAWGEGASRLDGSRDSARVQWQAPIDFHKPADPILEVWRRAAQEAAHRFNVPESAVLGTSRLSTATLARHAAWFTMRDTYGYSWNEIAMAVGRDHSSVMAGVKTFARQCGLVNWRV